MNALRLKLDPFRVRVPGFVKPASLALNNRAALERSSRVLDYLERGELPPVTTPTHALRVDPPEEPPLSQYYRGQYPDICRDFRRLWERLEALERRTSQPPQD